MALASSRNIVIEPDEGAWIASTPYFFHFLAGDSDHPDWRDPDAIDHPPLAKYFYGAALALGGERIQDLGLKRWWQEQADGHRLFELPHAWIIQRIPLSTIHIARIGAAIASFLSLILVSLIGARLFSPQIGALGALFTAWNAEFRTIGTQALADPVLVLVVLLGFLATLHWVDAVATENRGRQWSIALLIGIIAGLGFSTKFNGCLILAAPLFAAGLANTGSLRTPVTRGCLVLAAQVIVMAAAAAIIALLLNPALWPNPAAALAAMWHHRIERIAIQRFLFGCGFAPLGLKASMLWSHLAGLAPAASTIIAPVVVILLAAVGGILHLRAWRTRSCRIALSVGQKVFLCTALLWIASSAWEYAELQWPRYLFPCWPWLGIGAAIGARSIWRSVRSSRWMRICATIGAAALLGLLAYQQWKKPDVRTLVDRTRTPIPLKLIEQAAALEPNDFLLHAELAAAYGERGETAKAREQLRQMQHIDPENPLNRWMEKKCRTTGR